MLEVKNLSVILGKNTIVKNVSFNVHPGELVCILGNNGAGKSTLLKVINGEVEAQSGEILFNHRSVNNYSPGELARTRAVMPQNIELAFRFDAGDVVRLGRQPHGRYTQACETFTQTSMKATHVSHLSEHDYTCLSGGEKQRVQLARVFNQLEFQAESSKYLLVDECTSSLDIFHQHHIFRQLKTKAKTEGVGVLAVVHDVNLAAAFADRLGFMSNGELIAFGEPETVINVDVIEQVYGVKSIICPHPKRRHPLVMVA